MEMITATSAPTSVELCFRVADFTSQEFCGGDEIWRLYHLVEPGDTLWGISRIYGIRVAEIAVVNRIDNPDKIQSGLKLLIPLPDSLPYDIVLGPDRDRFFDEAFGENSDWSVEEQAVIALILNRPGIPSWQQVLVANRLLEEKGYEVRFFPGDRQIVISRGLVNRALNGDMFAVQELKELIGD